MTLNGDHYSLLGGAFTAFVYDAWLGLWYATDLFFIQFYNPLKQASVRTGWVLHLPDNMAHSPG
jgi:hypothetical protein